MDSAVDWGDAEIGFFLSVCVNATIHCRIRTSVNEPLANEPTQDKIDQRAFQGTASKENSASTLVLNNKIFVCVQNNPAYFPFMHCPLVANWKARWSIAVWWNVFWGKCQCTNCPTLNRTWAEISLKRFWFLTNKEVYLPIKTFGRSDVQCFNFN